MPAGCRALGHRPDRPKAPTMTPKERKAAKRLKKAGK
jgi:hypothetical protein